MEWGIEHIGGEALYSQKPQFGPSGRCFCFLGRSSE